MQTNVHVGRLAQPIKFRNEMDATKKTVAYVHLAIAGSRKDDTTFIDYVAFDKTADILNQLEINTGDILELNFEMRNNNYQDQKTQQEVYTVQNVIRQLRVYRSGKKESSSPTPAPEFNPTQPETLPENQIPPFDSQAPKTPNFFAGFDSLNG